MKRREWKIPNRLKCNLKILDILSLYFKENPNIRFIQGLWNMGIITRDENLSIIDRFYEESEDTLKMYDIAYTKIENEE